MLPVEGPLLLSLRDTSTCVLQGLLYVSVKSRTFSDQLRHRVSKGPRSSADLCSGSIRTKQPHPVSCKYQLYLSLHGNVVIKWFCRTLQFFRDFCPGARSNGLLVPRQSLGLQVLSHCQAVLIRSYKSWRDKCSTDTHLRH